MTSEITTGESDTYELLCGLPFARELRISAGNLSFEELHIKESSPGASLTQCSGLLAMQLNMLPGIPRSLRRATLRSMKKIIEICTHSTRGFSLSDEHDQHWFSASIYFGSAEPEVRHEEFEDFALKSFTLPLVYRAKVLISCLREGQYEYEIMARHIMPKMDEIMELSLKEALRQSKLRVAASSPAAAKVPLLQLKDLHHTSSAVPNDELDSVPAPSLASIDKPKSSAHLGLFRSLRGLFKRTGSTRSVALSDESRSPPPRHAPPRRQQREEGQSEEKQREEKDSLQLPLTSRSSGRSCQNTTPRVNGISPSPYLISRNNPFRPDVCSILQHIPLFSSLSRDELDSLVDLFAEVTVATGVDVVRQGDRADFMYIIESGTLSVSIETDDVVTRKRRELGRGDYFGELAILYDCPRAATVTATSECVLWQLHRKHAVRSSEVRISVN